MSQQQRKHSKSESNELSQGILNIVKKAKRKRPSMIESDEEKDNEVQRRLDEKMAKLSDSARKQVEANQLSNALFVKQVKTEFKKRFNELNKFQTETADQVDDLEEKVEKVIEKQDSDSKRTEDLEEEVKRLKMSLDELKSQYTSEETQLLRDSTVENKWINFKKVFL